MIYKRKIRNYKKNTDNENKLKLSKDKNNTNYKNILEKVNKNLKDKINNLNKSIEKIEENKKIQKSEKDTEKLVLMRQVEEFKKSLIDVNNQNKELITSLKDMKDKNEKLSNEILKVRSNNLRVEQKINQNKFDLLLADYNESIKAKENLEKKNKSPTTINHIAK